MGVAVANLKKAQRLVPAQRSTHTSASIPMATTAPTTPPIIAPSGDETDGSGLLAAAAPIAFAVPAGAARIDDVDDALNKLLLRVGNANVAVEVDVATDADCFAEGATSEETVVDAEMVEDGVLVGVDVLVEVSVPVGVIV